MGDLSGILVSIQIGKVQTHSHTLLEDSPQKTWTSAIVKTPVQGRIWVGRENLEGDEQADLKHHGGPDKAILGYCAEHYDLWKDEIPDRDWLYGGFGENFTISGMEDKTVCVGDTFLVGDIILQISEPRQPCHNLALLWQIKELPRIVLDNGRAGWYMRVLQEGFVEAGQKIERIDHPYPQWNMIDVSYILYHIGDDFDRAERLYECNLLSEKLRKFIRNAIDTHRPSPAKAGFTSTVKSFFRKMKP